MGREQEIFCAALERAATVEREAYLDAACAGEPALRSRVAALLRAAEAAGGFLDADRAPVHETTGSRIGRYVLRERLGEGGFGVVYLAEQDEPVRRTVALKIIKLGMDTRAVVARFEAERQALAMMDHPNIARVLDGGATETGRPYFVMELVRGVPITTFCNERRLPVAERLALFQQVGRAVHHAHQKGVIHRDLKPSNLIVTLHDERPVVKVIDFGIAKATHDPLTERTLMTRLNQFLGTPAYMSPEQVGIGGLDVDTRSDIYSLGAVLYEVLCDQPVLDAEAALAGGYAEVQRAIHRGEVRAPSQRVAALGEAAKAAVARDRRSTPPRLVGELAGDLDRIVLKCLEKDRTHRYETTDELAHDIERYLRNEPVLARPLTAGYRARKFFRRHRRSASLGAAAVVVLASLGGYHTRRLQMERDRAQMEARKAAKVSELLTELVTANDPFRTPTHVGALDDSAERVRTEFAGQPEVRVEILNAIGRVHLRRGDHEKALPILTEALAAGREIGRPDARVAQTLSDLGVLRREQGDQAAAVELFAESLAMRRTLLGDTNNDVAATLVELGRVHRSRERPELAEPLFREALAIRRAIYGEEHREIATNLGDLGQLMLENGALAEAEELLRQSLEMHRRTVGTEHPNFGSILGSLGQLALERGDPAVAERLTRRALEIYRKTMGAKSWRTGRMSGQLGETLRQLGRFEEAAAALDGGLEIVRAGVGNDQPLVAGLEIDRARLHLARGEAAEAERLLRDALRVQRLTYPAGGWHVASAKSLLGRALLRENRADEAAPLLAEAARVLKKMPGPRGRETEATRAALAEIERRRTGG